MSSSICHHFTQNAWKKDLCSNCFKSKDEHKQAAAVAAGKYAAMKTNTYTTSLTSLTTKMETSVDQKTDYPNKNKKPAKSIIKKTFTIATTTTKSHNGKQKSHKVCFPKNLSEVIGYGGEWSDNDSDEDDFDFVNIGNERDDLAATSTDDEETIEIKRITRANTDFNMNNGNLLGDPQENIKKSFAALKLGAPQVDKEGKKQTLKINVVPFGATATEDVIVKKPATTITTSTAAAKFETKSKEGESNEVLTKQLLSAVKAKKATTSTTSTTTTTKEQSIIVEHPTANSTSIKSTVTTVATKSSRSTALNSDMDDGKNSPPIERAMEKSLLDEISETLEKQKQKQTETQALADAKAQPSNNSNKNSVGTTSQNITQSSSKIKFEISSLSETLENKTFLELKKPIARNAPITKDHAKPKVNVFHKYSDSDSNCSDTENGVSAYYDVVETQISYENLPDGKYSNVPTSNKPTDAEQKSVYSSSQYITDMLLSSKTRAASYNLHEGNFMTSKITSDGLIVTKCSSDDALDSTGSSFDGSSDEETSYNMIRSESDSGIGISIGNEYKNVNVVKQRIEKKLSASTNNSDYEDIQIGDQAPALPSKATHGMSAKSTKHQKFSLEKSRELHGEPDGSADPDGPAEAKETMDTNIQSNLPALPKSPPPTKTIDARPSFLHGLQKQQPSLMLKKPDLPAKPLVSPVHSPMKTFMTKRLNANAEHQQVINQLHQVMTKHTNAISNSSTSNNEQQADNKSTAATDSAKDDSKLKKGKAPNPPPETKNSAPPTPERDYSLVGEFESANKREEQSANASKREEAAAAQSTNNASQSTANASPTFNSTSNASASVTQNATTTAANHYTRNSGSHTNTATNANNNGTSNNNSASNSTSKTTSPVIREKDKRERATINPKFRSLNTFVMQRAHAAKNLQIQNAGASYNIKQPMTPEPTPRNQKNLSLSQEFLAQLDDNPDGVGGRTTPTKATKNIAASIPNLLLASAATPEKKTSFFSTSSSTTTATSSSSITLSQPQKQKAKFSIKKFLRMGASKTTDNMHKKDSIYSEICTGDDGSTVGKPRLVIIHPIDINPTAVEVVKDITKTNDAVATQTIAVTVTTKPPAPPQRLSDGQRGALDVNKPARPPPPKSAELRRKQQKIALSTAADASDMTDAPCNSNGASACGSIKSKSDNVYANLGEIRSSIAPRKPERTASMREREAQLELARKRHGSGRNENADAISMCSSNGETLVAHEDSITSTTMQLSNSNKNSSKSNDNAVMALTDAKPPSGNRTSTFEKVKKSDTKIMLSNKLELFEQRNSTSSAQSNGSGTAEGAPQHPLQNEQASNSRPSSLKDSVRKINSTIDSYLKDKREYENMYEMVKSPASPPPPPARSPDNSAADVTTEVIGNIATIGASTAAAQRRRNQIFSDTASLASFTRSEYAPANQRSYGFHNSLANIPRIISASYCGSEMGEFDIYAPYSYYGSETGGDVATDINDSVWGMPSTTKNRIKATNRLRMRKGRSVVHKNIEDNYTAVVVANHEALAQVLDQLQQTPIIPPALRPLANAINLRFEDFSIIDGAQAFVVGKKAFHAAIWTTAPVTLALSADCNQLAGVGGELNQLSGGVSGVLNPITEFCDIVPSYHLPLMPSTEVQMLQATISVLPRLQLDTLQTIGAILKGKSQVLDKSNFNFRGSIPNLSGCKEASGTTTSLRNVVSVQNLSTLNEESSLDLKLQQQHTGDAANAAPSNGNAAATMPAFDDVMTREVAFIMLQLINGMKHLQVKATEEMPLSLSNVVLSKDMDNKDAQARLCVLQGNNNDEDEPMGTLCKCAHIALTEMLPATKITPIVANILQQERAESLSKVKSVLEFVLWGPSDVTLTGTTKERELALQRWLDLERATVLHGLVRTRVELTVYDECHLMFLVRSTAKIMNDAAKVVCSYQQPVAPATSAGAKED